MQLMTREQLRQLGEDGRGLAHPFKTFHADRFLHSIQAGSLSMLGYHQPTRVFDDLASAPSNSHGDLSWTGWSALFLGSLIGGSSCWQQLFYML